MGRFLTIIATFMVATSANGAEIAPDYYHYPLEGVERLYAGNVGEMRGGHFHAGVDIKSDGVEGKRVVAAADGYISRVDISPFGYGKVIYIAHPNGTTTVYGHLSKYRKDIEKYVTNERLSRKQHSVKLYFNSKQFPVKGGELIAYSGNTGSSGGPHLHYEVRESASQSPLNIFKREIIKPRDTQAPLLFTLHYIEIDSVGGVAYPAPLSSYELRRNANNNYTLADSTNTVNVGRHGFFVLECSDRKDGVTNTFGIYSLRGYCDSTLFFAYQNDGFTFADTPYCKAVSYQPIKVDSRNEVVRMSISENNSKRFYPDNSKLGVIGCEPDQRHAITIDVEDDCSLKSTLQFDIVGNNEAFKATQIDPSKMIYASRDFAFTSDSLRVNVPRGTLYDSTPFYSKIAENPKLIEADSIKLLSKCITILGKEIALHKSIEVSIKCEVEPELKDKVTMAMVNKNGELYGIGGKFIDGWITAQSRTAGEFIAAIDNIAPQITPNFSEGFNMVNHEYMSFKVSDNLSGIADYECYIDGKWAPLDLEHGVLKHYFYNTPTESKQRVKIIVKDKCNNESIVERTFIR